MKATKWLVPILALAAVGGGAWYFFFGTTKKVEYITAKLERGDIESVVSATGSCNAVVSVQVGSQVSGNILALNADFNTRVTKNQIVAVIDPAPFQARLDQARANVEASRGSVQNSQAQLKKSDADIAGAEANVANQRANVVRAQSSVADAKTRLARRVELFDQKIASREDRDTAQAAYDQAVANLEAAQAQLVATSSNLVAVRAQQDVVRSQLLTAQSQVKQQEANMQQSQLDLEHTEIRAPVDGTVIARNMDVGQTVAASFSAPTIFQIAQDLTKMQVDANIDESDISRIQLGQQTTFTVDAYPGQRFVGEVSQVRRAPINVQNVITYVVVIAVDNPDQKLFPGMTANVRILTDRMRNVLKMPTSALRVRLEGVEVTDRGKEIFQTSPAEIEHDQQVAKQAEAARIREAKGAGGAAPKRDDSKGGQGRGGFTRGDGKNFDPKQIEAFRNGKGGFDREAFRRARDGSGGDSKNNDKKTAKNDGKQADSKQAPTTTAAQTPDPATGGNTPGGQGGGRGKGRGGRGGGAGGATQIATVYVMGDDGKPKGERVRLGIGDGSFVAVLSQNLEEGQNIVTGVLGGTTTTAAPGFPGQQGGKGKNNNFKGGFGF